jgi:diguanylate cyclase (GGDEF)-like protein
MEGLYEAAFEALLRGSDDLILVIDREGRILDAGALARWRLGANARLSGVSLLERLSVNSGRALRAFLDALGTDGAITLEHVERDTGVGDIRRIRYAVHAIPNSGRRRDFLLVGREVHEPEASADGPNPAAIDPLTGLANRLGLAAGLARLWSESGGDSEHPLAWVLVADLDQFKAVNDAHGHAAGDEVLAAAARVLVSSVREGDLAARYGGDEFVLAGWAGGARDVAAIAHRVVEAVRALEVARPELQKPIHVTISAGAVLVFPGPEISPKLALEAADRAMYRAKGAGRDRAEIEPEVLGA